MSFVPTFLDHKTEPSFNPLSSIIAGMQPMLASKFNRIPQGVGGSLVAFARKVQHPRLPETHAARFRFFGLLRLCSQVNIPYVQKSNRVAAQSLQARACRLHCRLLILRVACVSATQLDGEEAKPRRLHGAAIHPVLHAAQAVCHLGGLLGGLHFLQLF